MHHCRARPLEVASDSDSGEVRQTLGVLPPRSGVRLAMLAWSALAETTNVPVGQPTVACIFHGTGDAPAGSALNLRLLREAVTSAHRWCRRSAGCLRQHEARVPGVMFPPPTIAMTGQKSCHIRQIPVCQGCTRPVVRSKSI